jgi:hypothetical protein
MSTTETKPTSRPPANHDLKVWPGDFNAIVDGRKTADIRRCDDRKFRVGDLLTLREWDPASSSYTSRLQRARITHVDRMAGPRMFVAIAPSTSNDVVACVVLCFAKIST